MMMSLPQVTLQMSIPSPFGSSNLFGCPKLHACLLQPPFRSSSSRPGEPLGPGHGPSRQCRRLGGRGRRGRVRGPRGRRGGEAVEVGRSACAVHGGSGPGPQRPHRALEALPQANTTGHKRGGRKEDRFLGLVEVGRAAWRDP